jgi:hypothetical protein
MGMVKLHMGMVKLHIGMMKLHMGMMKLHIGAAHGYGEAVPAFPEKTLLVVGELHWRLGRRCEGTFWLMCGW